MKGKDDLEIDKFLISSKPAQRKSSPNFGLGKRPETSSLREGFVPSLGPR